jgi:hypothetical protein
MRDRGDDLALHQLIRDHVERPTRRTCGWIAARDHGDMGFHPTIDLDGRSTARCFLENIADVFMRSLAVLLPYMVDGAA